MGEAPREVDLEVRGGLAEARTDKRAEKRMRARSSARRRCGKQYRYNHKNIYNYTGSYFIGTHPTIEKEYISFQFFHKNY
jgi:hypothetical protein